MVPYCFQYCISLLWGNGGMTVTWKFLMCIESHEVLRLILPDGQPLLTQILTLLQLRRSSSPILVSLLSLESQWGGEV